MLSHEVIYMTLLAHMCVACAQAGENQAAPGK